MQLKQVTKIREGLYKASSLPCPDCNDVLEIELLGSKLYAYNQGAYVQEVFPDMNDDDRERFVSGVCPPCWEKTFPDEDE